MNAIKNIRLYIWINMYVIFLYIYIIYCNISHRKVKIKCDLYLFHTNHIRTTTPPEL